MRLHEIELVERLGKLAGGARVAPRAVSGAASGALRLRQAIGDDCAVFSAGGAQDLLVTTDLFIEDVHFRRAWQPAHSIGHKVLTRGLSDIAAMGGTPRLAFLSLALPRKTTQRWIDEFLRGFLTLANRYSVVLAGGDTGSSPHGFMADIIVVGEVPRGKAVLRSGARAGDAVWVSGKLGGAALDLARLRRLSGKSGGQADSKSNKTKESGAANPYFFPQARVAVGEYLRTHTLASAMMDITDGLSLDLLRLTRASGVGAVVDEADVPRAVSSTATAGKGTASRTALSAALHGGDDFELLFTVPSRMARHVPKAINGVPLSRIGRITKQPGVRIASKGVTRPLAARGYQHF